MTNPHDPTIDELLDRSAAISQLIRRADAMFRKNPSRELAESIRHLEAAEREARQAARNHPDMPPQG